MFTEQNARHKTGVLMPGGVNLDLDYEPMLEALNGCGRSLKARRPYTSVIQPSRGGGTDVTADI